MNASVVSYVEKLHAVVDQLAGQVEARLGDRLKCRSGCSSCCTDDLTVFEAEAAVIQRHHGAVLATSPGPAGACALLDDAGRCRVYANRPYVCRTQGLPLRWIEEELEDDEVVAYEARDICPLNAEGAPLEELPVESCWSIGPFEARLRAAQEQTDDGEGRRIALRDLFGAPPLETS